MSKKKDMHPNSLANLRPAQQITKENAAEMARKSHAVRRAKAEARRVLEEAIDGFKHLKVDMPPAVDVLRIAMAKAIESGDMDEATRLAIQLAPFETPKLASKEVNITEGLKEKTDEELAQLAKEFGLDLEAKDKH